MDVGRQSNGSDCGVLTLAFAYNICSGNDPCKIKYDHRSMRQHLAEWLKKCRLSPLASQWLVSAGLLVSGTPSQCIFIAPAACPRKKTIQWPSVMYVKPGTTNTAWTFLAMFLKAKQRSPGSVNHVPQCETPPSILL